MSSSGTDLAKMGKYIAELRKSKKYTQRQLGDLIDVNYKTISKWENGIVAPDITLLKSLADVLEVTVDEILCGERIKKIEERNSATVEGIKIYIKKAYKKVLGIVFIIFIVLFIFALYFIGVNNYYKWHVLDLSFSDKELFITGHITFNREKTLIVLDEFAYTSNEIGTLDEIKVKSMKVTLYVDNKEVANSERIFDESEFLHHCFEGYYFVYDGKNHNENFKEGKIDISIKYTDDNDGEQNVILRSN